MPVERVDSLDDPRVADYRNVRDADLLGRRGVFMAEGDLVVRTLVDRSAFTTRSLLLSETRLEAMSDLVGRLPESVPVYVAAQNVMNGIVGFHIHRGCLAAGERPAERDPADLARACARATRPLLILEDLANHDNVGGLFRNAAAFGGGGILLTRRCCDPLYRKAIRVSIGTALTLPFAFVGDSARAIALARECGLETIALTPDPASQSLASLVRAGGVRSGAALLIGAEGPGLTRAALAEADRRVRIDIEAEVDSLNAMVAGAIALFALRAARV
jgi:tRNA G18 (ribose-2'-O)-methylase SpoU